jgi:NarL family two-component system response regulator LiaR
MHSSDPIRVMIVDEHNMVRRALAMFLRVCEDLELVGEATNGKEALWMCEQLQPDVILMDLLMPVMDGLTATRLIREQWPEVQVIALTSFHEEELVHDALDAGAIGYLLKNVSSDRLADAIRAACVGQSTLAPEASQALIQAANEEPAPSEAPSAEQPEAPALMVDSGSDSKTEKDGTAAKRPRLV